MKPHDRQFPPLLDMDDNEEVYTALSFRMSATVAARALLGISVALHRIADAMDRVWPPDR